MSTRPGIQAQDILSRCVGRCFANLIRLTRPDGAVLRFTDHDRAITIDGETYSSAQYVASSRENREAALRSGDQEFYGLIDGQAFRINDLSGHLYRGSLIEQRLVDFRYPWVEFMSSVKRVTQVRFTETSWIATAKALSASMENSKGGRFNGINTITCGYQLGGPYCKKDISALINMGVKITSVVSGRSEFLTDAATWLPTSFADDYFREGDIEILWGPVATFGTTPTAVTVGSTTFTDGPGTPWTVDQWKGFTVRILSAAGGYVLAYRTIFSNTTTVLTVAPAWSTAHSGTVYYDIVPTSDLAGTAFPISSYVASTRKLQLFFPTPRLLTVGHSGIVRPGCDGLKSTCKAKYSNVINFGGIDAFAPTPADIIKTPEDQ